MPGHFAVGVVVPLETGNVWHSRLPTVTRLRLLASGACAWDASAVTIVRSIGWKTKDLVRAHRSGCSRIAGQASGQSA